MPVMDGNEATRPVAGDSAARVLMLTTFDLDEYVRCAAGPVPWLPAERRRPTS